MNQSRSCVPGRYEAFNKCQLCMTTSISHGRPAVPFNSSLVQCFDIHDQLFMVGLGSSGDVPNTGLCFIPTHRMHYRVSQIGCFKAIEISSHSSGTQTLKSGYWPGKLAQNLQNPSLPLFSFQCLLEILGIFQTHHSSSCLYRHMCLWIFTWPSPLCVSFL